jgi:hypothetical protein
MLNLFYFVYFPSSKINKSSVSRLVILNLPHYENLGVSPLSYLHYVEAITEGLNTCVLIRGSGDEVVSLSSE